MIDIQVATKHLLLPDELAELEQLIAACQREDGNIIPVYPQILTQYRINPCCLLGYYQEKLIAFLGTYFFYEDACEIALMVSPKYRRQGIAKHLFKTILPLLQLTAMQKIYLSLPAKQNPTWLSAWGGIYHNSEYQMLRDMPNPIAPFEQVSSIRPATLLDLPFLCALDKVCFATPTQQAEYRFSQLIDNPEYSVFLAELNNTPIGKAHICWQACDARLTDIAVIPNMQGQGFGKELTAYCINTILARHITQIRLDVETTNLKALHLYEQLNFKPINAHEYWVFSLPMESFAF